VLISRSIFHEDLYSPALVEERQKKKEYKLGNAQIKQAGEELYRSHLNHDHTGRKTIVSISQKSFPMCRDEFSTKNEY
jgi:hypothetical protein